MEFEKLKKIIAEVLNVDPDEITMETTFQDDLGADSLDVFQIIMGIEEDFDIEIVEKHHNQKIDAPSGTAIMLADAINEELDEKYNYVYDRHSVRAKRSQTEIGIRCV